jgi:hypothetical protein
VAVLSDQPVRKPPSLEHALDELVRAHSHIEGLRLVVLEAIWTLRGYLDGQARRA